MLLMVNKLGWIDSYHVQIIPFIADAFSVFLFYQFFIQVPKDFDEAAIIDGTGYFSVYTRIIAPLSRPVFASVAILQGIQHWGPISVAPDGNQTGDIPPAAGRHSAVFQPGPQGMGCDLCLCIDDDHSTVDYIPRVSEMVRSIRGQFRRQGLISIPGVVEALR